MRAKQVSRVVLCIVLVLSACGALVGQVPRPGQPKGLNVDSHRVSMDMKDVDVREALKTLFRGENLRYSIDSNVTGTIPMLKFYDLPFSEAVKNVAMAAGLVYRVDSGVYVFSPNPAVMAPLQKQVNIEFQDTPLGDAIETLLKDSEVSYTVDPNVNQLKVTAVLRSVTLEKALAEITKAAGAEFRFSNGVVSVSERRPAPKGPVFMPAAPHLRPEGQVTEIVSLRFLEPDDAASFVVDTPGLEVRAISGGKLILRGPEEAVANAIGTISALDDESVLPRPVRIRLVASVMLGTGQAQSADLSTESVGPEGHPIPLNINSQSTESYEVTMNVISGEKLIEQKTPQFVNRPSNLFVTLTPTVGADGRIVLAGNGRIDCNVAGDGPMSTWQVAKDFEVAVSAEPGKPVTIAAGEVSTGTNRAQFVVTATATIDPGRVQIPPPTPQPTRPTYGTSPGYGGSGSYGGSGGYRGW